MVRQPENAKRHHDSQDEFLAADWPAELGLPQAPQDEDVAGYDGGIREDESRDRLKGIMEPHLHTGGCKTDTIEMIACVSVDMNKAEQKQYDESVKDKPDESKSVFLKVFFL